MELALVRLAFNLEASTVKIQSLKNLALFWVMIAFLARTTLHGATVTWTGPSGDWNTAANWSTGALPGPNDNVVIGSGPAITVTHSSGTHAVQSITSQQAFTLSGGVLAVSATAQINNAFVLSGGTLAAATVLRATNGAALQIAGGAILNGVTINGTLDVGNSFDNVGVTVTNGLVLNGTAIVGNPTNQWNGGISFAGSQTLSGSGTVVFGNNGEYSYNTLRVSIAGTALAIGPGIAIQGQDGVIGYASAWGGPTNVSVINSGTVSELFSAGTMTFAGSTLLNQGLLSALNGGEINVAASLSNNGTFNATNSAVGLGGTFALADLGTFNVAGAKIYLRGTLNNAGATLVINPLEAAWILNGGAIKGGTIVTANGGALVVGDSDTRATLDAVTLNGTLDVGNSFDNVGVTVTNGLVLNGTAIVGNPTNQWNGGISFAGSQTLSGSGTVVFGNNGEYSYNTLRVSIAGTALTIGPGIAIQGQNGVIGYASAWGGPQIVSVINEGTISDTVNQGAISFAGGPLVNQGALLALNGGGLTFSGGLTNNGTIGATNSVINFQGTLISSNLGAFNTSGGAVNFTGLIDNTNTTLNVNKFGAACVLSGVTINGGAIAASNGSVIVISGSSCRFNGVAVDGVLDIGNTSPNIYMTVSGGLTLNGRLLLGNPTNSSFGELFFEGSQTLGGNATIIGGNNGTANNGTGYDGLFLYTGATLTIGPGVTLAGQNLVLGYVPGSGNFGFINHGNIVDIAGGKMGISGTWTNTGLIAVTNSTLVLYGTYSQSSLGPFQASRAAIELVGAWLNANATLEMDATSNNWTLAGGSIAGGTVLAINGTPLLVNGSGTLSGVELDAPLDVGQTYSDSILTVTNGLTLNGTATLGNSTNGGYGALKFVQSQTLSGDGTIMFEGTGCNSLWPSVSGAILTIGPDITIHGRDGQIGAGNCFNPSANAGVVNQGVISADVSGGNISVGGAILTNQGALRASAGATLAWSGSLDFAGQQNFACQPGGTIAVGGNILGSPAGPARFNPQGVVSFGAGAHQLEAMSQDVGDIPKGFANNFDYGEISLAAGAQVQLVNLSTNTQGLLPECVYANSLNVPAGASINLNGLHLYIRLAVVAGTITNGVVTQAPTSGGSMNLANTVSGALTNVGALATWTFFGRAGQKVTVAADPGSVNILPPQLQYAFVRLFDPASNLLAQGSNAVAGQTVLLNGIALPADGTYRVEVDAPANHAASAGNYQISIWDVTPSVGSLVINQQINAQIANPYSVDQWNFTAAAGQQIAFDLLNASTPGIAFNLAGPNGWVGFSNLATGSGLITLPLSGAYTLTAYGTGGQYGGNFAFQLVETAETNILPGRTFAEQMVGSGQAQLIAINITNAEPARIVLSLAAPGNSVELYAQFGSPPTRNEFDYKYTGASAQTEDIIIPSPSPGVWYILVYGNYVGQPLSYSLEVVQTRVILASAAPETAVASDNTVLFLTGAGFTPAAVVQLTPKNGGSALMARDMTVVSPTEMSVFFASNTIPPGTYTVCVSSGGDTSCATNLLTGSRAFRPAFLCPASWAIINPPRCMSITPIQARPQCRPRYFCFQARNPGCRGRF
jgi:hypothetical protein